jgi:hypothetical protein
MVLPENTLYSPNGHSFPALYETASQPLWSQLDVMLPSLLALPVCMIIALEQGHSDSSIFMYAGQSCAKETVPYVQIFDNKPPGLYVLIVLIPKFSLFLCAIALAQFAYVVHMIFSVSASLNRTSAPRRVDFFWTLSAVLTAILPFYMLGA